MSNNAPEPGADGFRKMGINTLAERQAFRARRDAQWEQAQKTNRTDPLPEETNPFRKVVEEMTTNRKPRTQREKNMLERYTALADQRDAEIAARKKEREQELIRDADPDFQTAKQHYVEVVATMTIETPADARDVAVATKALEANDLSTYYEAVGRIADRRLEAMDENLAKSRQEESDAKVARAKSEADAARVREIQAQGNSNLDRVSDSFEDPRL